MKLVCLSNSPIPISTNRAGALVAQEVKGVDLRSRGHEFES